MNAKPVEWNKVGGRFILRNRSKVRTNLSRISRSIQLLLPLLGLFGCVKSGVKPLLVGMELAYPPFEMTDKQGDPIGVSVDMAKALGMELGRPVKIENMSFDGLIPALKSGQIDCIISSLTATPERARAVDFSDPYVNTGLGLLVPIQSPVQSITDLNLPGTVVSVKRGTTGHIYAATHYPNLRLTVLDKENEAVLEVVEGKAQGFIYDQMSIYQNWQKNLTTTRAILTPFQEEHWAIAVAPGNHELLMQINLFLTHFRDQGGFEILGDKYLKEQKIAFKEMGIPFVFSR